MFSFQNPFSGVQNQQQQQQPSNNNNQNQNQQPQPNNNQNTTLQNGNQNNQTSNGNLIDPNQQNNNDPNNQNRQGQQSNGSDPLRDFTKLWDNPTPQLGADGQPIVPVKKSYVPTIKPEVMQQTVANMDFTKTALTPERVAAIQAGGEGATSAMMQIMNDAIRQAVTVSFQANSRLTEAAINNAETGFLEKVPGSVKDIMTENELTSSNPIMKDPSFGPMVDAVRRQFQDKFPKATPGQISGAVTAYFDDMHKKMTGIKDQSNKQIVNNTDKLRSGQPDADWNEWAEAEVASIFGEIPPNQNPNQNQNQQQVNSQSNQNQGTYTF